MCTWLYLILLGLLYLVTAKTRAATGHDIVAGQTKDAKEWSTPRPWKTKSTLYKILAALYYLLIVAQILMCILEITRLSLAHLGIGLLPFTFVALIVAAILRLTFGLRGRIGGWRWANLGLWILLAAANSVKLAEEAKESDGLGGSQRKGSKYMVVDELTDVGVMVGVYVAISILEVTLGP